MKIFNKEIRIFADKEKVEPEQTIQQTALSYLRDFVILVLVVVLVNVLLFRVVIVSGPSMKNTLVDGDWLILLSSAVYGDPQQGDIIVASKESFENGEPIIKRVIATEGQTVNINFSTGIVYVDGTPMDEPYTLTPTNTYEGINFPIVVEEGCLFVMGDNRNSSKDSRSIEIGQIDCREVMGKAIFLIFPGKANPQDSRDFGRIGVVS